MYRPHFSVPLGLIVAGITGASPADATVRAGYAMLVENNVSGTQSGQQRKVFKGDDVFENDFIRTEVESSTRLLFVDKTQLVLGPKAIAKLDRLVFNPDHSVSALTVSARAGAVRWISGDSPPSAYQIETTTLALRVHGTEFDLFVEPQRTTVLLREGIVEACLIDAPQRCKVLSRPGEMITATRNTIEGFQRAALGSSDFEDRCLSAATRECVIDISVAPPREDPPREDPPSKSGFGQRRAERAPSNTSQSTSVAALDPSPAVNAVRPGVIPPPVIVTPPYVPPRLRIRSNPNPSDEGHYPTQSTGTGHYSPSWPNKRKESPTAPTRTGHYTPSSSNKGKGSSTPSTNTGHYTPSTGSDKGKESARVYKNNSQVRGSIGDNPRLSGNRNVAMAHASVESVKRATPVMASSIGAHATSMVPRQSFARIGGIGAPRLSFGRIGFRSFGLMGLFRHH
jgi:hypothetical protein